MKPQYSDILGGFCSGLCLLHCLAGPILLALGGAGLLGSIIFDEAVHAWLLVPIWGFVLLSFPRAYMQHGFKQPLIFAGVGVSLVTAALLVEGALEILSTTVGGLCLIYAHRSNWKILSAKAVTADNIAAI